MSGEPWFLSYHPTWGLGAGGLPSPLPGGLGPYAASRAGGKGSPRRESLVCSPNADSSHAVCSLVPIPSTFLLSPRRGGSTTCSGSSINTAPLTHVLAARPCEGWKELSHIAPCGKQRQRSHSCHTLLLLTDGPEGSDVSQPHTGDCWEVFYLQPHLTFQRHLGL